MKRDEIIIERKVGEKFYDGKVQLEVVEADWGCMGCHYKPETCGKSIEIRGHCSRSRRDLTPVSFQKVEQ